MFPELAASKVGSTAQSIEASPDVAATFIGEFQILAMIVDQMISENVKGRKDFPHKQLLKTIHGLSLEEARSVKAEDIVPESNGVIRDEGLKLFARFSKNHQ